MGEKRESERETNARGNSCREKNIRLQRVRKTELQAPEFGEAAQAADKGVAGARRWRLREVVEHRVAVIGTQGDLPIRATGGAALGLLFEESADDGGHVFETIEERVLIEDSVVDGDVEAAAVGGEEAVEADFVRGEHGGKGGLGV